MNVFNRTTLSRFRFSMFGLNDNFRVLFRELKTHELAGMRNIEWVTVYKGLVEAKCPGKGHVYLAGDV